MTQTTLYCIAPAYDERGRFFGGTVSHTWRGDAHSAAPHHPPRPFDTVFVNCPDHDGLPNAEGADHRLYQYLTAPPEPFVAPDGRIFIPKETK